VLIVILCSQFKLLFQFEVISEDWPRQSYMSTDIISA